MCAMLQAKGREKEVCVKNNNQEAIKLLAGKLYAANHRRNYLLTGAVAVSFFLLFSIFSIVFGRIHAEKLKYTRMAGETATTLLEDAVPKQAEQIAKLDYIRDVGMLYILGGIYKEQESVGLRVYVDKTTYHSMLKPAYTSIHGEYPDKRNEVMLSVRTLRQLGITQPEVGRPLKIEGQEGEEEEFVLSGFYTEYLPEEDLPYAFFSEKYYGNQKDSTKQSSFLLIRQKDWYSGEDIEARLYRDIPTIDKAQQFIGGDSVSYTAVLELVGGLDIGVFCAILIVLCAGMLIYNVVAISMRRDIRQYGLLKTIGTTSCQIYRMIWKQAAKILLIGLTLGIIAGGVLIFLILPGILEEKYLEGFGKASAIISFHPLLFLGAIFLTVANTFFCSSMSVRKVGKMAPVEALHYLGGITYTGKKTRCSVKGNQISVMAWRNIFRNRKNALVTLGSLFLGFLVALGAMVIIRGMDYRNMLEQDDDFTLYASSAPFLSEGYLESDIQFDSSFVERIKELDGVEEVKCSVGGYLGLNSDDAVWNPLLTGSRMQKGMQKDKENKVYAEHVRKYYMAGFTVVDKSFIDVLEQCCEKYQLSLDIEGLRKGTSAVAFHFNELSRQLEEEAVSCIGEEFSLKTFSGENLGTMRFGGYLKRNQKGILRCETESSTSGYPTLLISENGLENLRIEGKIFAIKINVALEKEGKIKWKLNHMVAELGKKQKVKEGEFGSEYSLSSKSDTIASVESDLLPVRTLMYVVSALLVCMGLFNYFNVTISSLEARKTEFIVMESLGMTGKQLRKMLILEGFYYSSLIAIFLITAGSGAMRLIYRLGKERIPYMQFYYPGTAMMVLLVMIYAGCICLPLWFFRKNKWEAGTLKYCDF